MKNFLKIVLIMLMLVGSLSLTGCFERKPKEPSVSVEECIQESGFKKSEKGKILLYYYATQTEVSLYYCDHWKTGNISCKRYFIDKSTYELEKSLAQNIYKADDSNYSFYIKEYASVGNMDDYWDEIASSSIYQIVE